MTPRAEFFIALMAAYPTLVFLAFVSLLLCASVFIGSVFLNRRSQYAYAAALPLQEDSLVEHKGDIA